MTALAGEGDPSTEPFTFFTQTVAQAADKKTVTRTEGTALTRVTEPFVRKTRTGIQVTQSVLLAAGFLPPVWLPDKRTRSLRRQVTRRAHLVRQRTWITNQVHAILTRNLALTPPVSDLFGITGRHWLSRQGCVNLTCGDARSGLKIGGGGPLTPVVYGRWRPCTSWALGAVLLGASVLLRARGLDSAFPGGSCGLPPAVHPRPDGRCRVLQETQDREEIIQRVAALDIGKAELVCCVRVPDEGRAGRRLQEVETYSAMTRSLPGRPAALPGGDPGGDGGHQ
jgi:hypothetical protein